MMQGLSKLFTLKNAATAYPLVACGIIAALIPESRNIAVPTGLAMSALMRQAVSVIELSENSSTRNAAQKAAVTPHP